MEKDKEDLKKSSIRDLIKEADQELVQDFLANILRNDDKLYNKFKSYLSWEVSPEDMRLYKKQVVAVFHKYAGKHKFINYYNAGYFALDLDDFLNYAEGMINNKQYKEAFDLSSYIFVRLANQAMDDSGGEIGMIAERCKELWRKILQHCDLKVKKLMFRWYINHLDGSIIDYMEDHLEDILFENFEEDEFLEDKLIFTDNKIIEYKQKEDSWSKGYNAGKWIIYHLEVMDKKKVSEEKIEEYCKENLEFDKVRSFYINHCIKKNDYDTAIHILKEGKDKEKDSPGTLRNYSMQLKDLYKEMGKSEDYKKELWSLLLQYNLGDLNVYKELKTLYSEEEWKEKREIIFEKVKKYSIVDRLYKEEKLYDRLLNFVVKSAGLGKVMEHEELLKGMYPNELLAKYADVVNIMASNSSDRKRYHELVIILRRMQKYSEGKNKVDEIVDNWRSLYKNRRAMMDELNKL